MAWAPMHTFSLVTTGNNCRPFGCPLLEAPIQAMVMRKGLQLASNEEEQEEEEIEEE